MVGLNDLEGLLQPKQFYVSMILCAETPKLCWSWVQEQYSCTGISVWLWWQALLLSWT